MKPKPKVFRTGETVWYYPLGKERPNYRRKVTILEVKIDSYGHKMYRVETIEKTVFPTFVGGSVLEKAK